MTINKQALREAAEKAIGAHERLSIMPSDDIFDISLHEGTQLDADITDLNAFNEAANPATVLALLDELEAADALNKHLELAIRKAEGCSEALRRKSEAADRRNAELNSTLERWATDRAQSASELDDAEKRIAELEQDKLRLHSVINTQANIAGLTAAGIITRVEE